MGYWVAILHSIAETDEERKFEIQCNSCCSTTVRRLLMPIGVLSSYLLIDNVQNILTYLLIGTIHHITYQAILT